MLYRGFKHRTKNSQTHVQDIDLKSLMVNICFKLPLQSTYLLLDLKSQNKLQKVLRRDLSALWASRRASAQAVTSKWHFRTTSPINTPSPAGEN